MRAVAWCVNSLLLDAPGLRVPAKHADAFRSPQRVEVDLDYTDHVSLDISTCVVVNFPRPRFAVLPIRLGLTLERFSGTLTLELPSPLSTTSSTIGHTHPTLNLSLHPDFTLDLSTTSLLGSRAKLQDVPKVEQLILARIRGWIQDRVVWPGRVQVALPGLSKPTGRAGETSTDGDEGGWEWVTEDEATFVHNADSDDEHGSSMGSQSDAKASIDMEDGSPTIHLHPKVRRRANGPPSSSMPPISMMQRQMMTGRPPSPTDSLPGSYRGAPSSRTQSAWEQPREAEMRYRNGVGVGVGVPSVSSARGGNSNGY